MLNDLEEVRMATTEFATVGVTVVPDVQGFMASDRFKFDLGGTVRIGYVGDNFWRWFGSMTVPDHPGSVLVPHMLVHAHDRETIKTLGGEAKAETFLSEIWHLLSLQGRGQAGALLTNRYGNIFYVRDTEGVLRTVVIFYDGNIWDIEAYAIDSKWWDSGRRFFVHDSK